MDAEIAYFTSMTIVRSRLLAANASIEDEAPLTRAERLALQARKIVESVSYSALSGVEARNAQILREQRSKDADKVLSWLEKKGLLSLPSAQRISEPTQGFNFVLEGGAGAASGFDISASSLRDIYSRASEIIHERHPARLTPEWIDQALYKVEEDINKLRLWLWLHIMFLKNSGFLIQMGQYGTKSFMIPLTKQINL